MLSAMSSVPPAATRSSSRSCLRFSETGVSRLLAPSRVNRDARRPVATLPDLVGSPLSLNALRQDLQVSHKTVARWVQAPERLYALFRVPPFGAPRIRAVKKEQKHYHFDWSLVPSPAARFDHSIMMTR